MGQRVERRTWIHLLLLWSPRLDLPISTNGAKGRGRREVDREQLVPSLPLFYLISGADVGCMCLDWRVSAHWIRGREKSK